MEEIGAAAEALRAPATKGFPWQMLRISQCGIFFFLFLVTHPFAVPYRSLQEDPPLVCVRTCIIRTLYRLAAAESNTAKQREGKGQISVDWLGN